MTSSSNNGYFTVVTGASEGIGRALAEECAKEGHNLFLVALPGSGMPETSRHLAEKYGVRTEHFCVDLREADAPEKVYRYAANHQLAADFLINNAGIGHAGALEEHTQEEIDDIIMINIRALTSLTRLFIPELKKKPRSYILNVSSFGAFLPSAHKSVYLASKSYVYYFSESLRSELNGGPVKVSTLMPGPVYTNDNVRKRIRNNGFFGRATALESEQVARYALDRIRAGTPVIIPGNLNRTLRTVLSFLPYFLLMGMMKRLFTGKGR